MITATFSDPAAIGTLGALIVSVAAGIYGLMKVKPEAESIATKTTLAVIEAQGKRLKESEDEAVRLRFELRKRDGELETLQRRFAALRIQFDQLEAELNSLRGAHGPG